MPYSPESTETISKIKLFLTNPVVLAAIHAI